ncbi:MAG TPA: zf-HC2 domain-containing protein [Candidatus Eisenbacteria bacterium]|nr:zf-HC2 domain-containing protein [Candidatus Eisenbacteria bacterium]
MKENLTCETCERELLAYADGVLHPAVARVMEQHLDGCGRCRASLAWHRLISERVAALPGIPVPAGLEERVLRAVAGPARAKARWRRLGAGALALSFAGTIGGIAFWPRLAKLWGLPDPASALAGGLDSMVEGLIAIPKRIAVDVAFYEPIARQVVRSMDGLAALPRAVLVSLRSPEAQAAGLMLLTLGVALYLLLRPSRRKEGGMGHACLAL